MIQTNKWVVLWKESNRSFSKSFESNPPTPAVDFAKQLKRKGVAAVDVVSRRRAFPPPLKAKVPDRPGVLWCPYCIKWREFHEAALKDGEGLLGPVLLRCKICTISIRDAYIRRYNPLFYARWETEQEMKKQALLRKKEQKAKLTSVHRTKRKN